MSEPIIKSWRHRDPGWWELAWVQGLHLQQFSNNEMLTKERINCIDSGSMCWNVIVSLVALKMGLWWDCGWWRERLGGYNNLTSLSIQPDAFGFMIGVYELHTPH